MEVPKFVYRLVVKAQAYQPTLTGKVIGKLTSSSGKSHKSSESTTVTRTLAPGEGYGVAAANKAAGVPEPSAEGSASQPLRTSGVRTANLAAGVPGAR